MRLALQSSKNQLYKGTFDCLKSTIQKESISGLYKGMSACYSSWTMLVSPVRWVSSPSLTKSKQVVRLAVLSCTAQLGTIQKYHTNNTKQLSSKSCKPNLLWAADQVFHLDMTKDAIDSWNQQNIWQRWVLAILQCWSETKPSLSTPANEPKKGSYAHMYQFLN